MYFLDTNVVSELRKVRLGKVDSHLAEWADSVDATDLYISVITTKELEIGVLLEERCDPAQGTMLRTWLNEYVLPAFAGRILSIDTTIPRGSAQLQIPNQRPVRDGLITATALVHAMTMVMRNTADFEAAGIAPLNPWAAR